MSEAAINNRVTKIKQLATNLFNDFLAFIHQQDENNSNNQIAQIIEFYQPSSKQVLVAIYFNKNKDSLDLFININNKLQLIQSSQPIN